MKILLIAATFREIEPFIAAYPDTEVLVTGVGSASTIYHLQKKLQGQNYDLVIQAGIAGSFTEKYTLGETVIAFQDTFGDMGAEEKENLSTIFDMGLANKDEFPYKNGWLVNPNDYLQQSSLKKAIAVTVNKVTDNPLQTKQLLLKFNAEIESMEGAALHYVCLQEKIAFMQLRGISNYVGERNKLKWKMKESIISLNKELVRVFEELKKKN